MIIDLVSRTSLALNRTRKVRHFVSRLNGYKETRYAARFALVGVAIATALAIYVNFLSTAEPMAGRGLFVVLCPPSLSAMPLNSAGWDEALVHWLFIALANAMLYATVGLLFGAAAEEKPE